MKHSIALKFLAIVLCAASLLGAVGSALGIVFLTEQGLYSRGLEDLRAAQLSETADYYAENVLSYYITANLGGYPAAALTDMFQIDTRLASGQYGYRILDADGQVLDSLNEELKKTTGIYQTYSAPEIYRYVLGVEPLVEAPEPTQSTSVWIPYVVDAVPDGETVPVYRLSADDGAYVLEEGSGDPIGDIWKDEDGNVTFRSRETGRNFPTQDVSQVEFTDANGEVIYAIYADTAGNDTVGFFNLDGTYHLIFHATSHTDAPVLEESGEEVYVHDHIPGEDRAAVYGLTIHSENESEGISTQNILGYVYHNQEGQVLFESEQTGILDSKWITGDGVITGIRFVDQDGAVVYEAQSTDAVGYFYYGTGAGAEEASVCFVAGASPSGSTSGVVSDYIHAYDAPSLASSVRGSLGAGYPVEILTTARVDEVEWGYVQGMGWILMSQVTTPDSTEAAQSVSLPAGARSGNLVYHGVFPDAYRYIGVAQEAVTAHVLASSGSKPLEEYEAGTTFGILYQSSGTGGTWGYIGDSWINLEQVTVTQAPETEANQDDWPYGDTIWEYKAAKAVTLLNTPKDDAVEIMTLSKGSTLIIYRTVTIGEQEWGYTGQGWVSLENLTLLETTDVTAQSVDAEPAAADAEETPGPEGVHLADTRVYYDEYYDYEAQKLMRLSYSYAQSPEYVLELYLQPEALDTGYDALLEWIVQNRTNFFYVLAVSLIAFAVTVVYLCCAAGRGAKDGAIRATGLNRVPLDLHFTLDCGAGIGLVFAIAWETPRLLQRDLQIGCGYCLGLCFGISLILVSFCFACVAQIKTGGGYWWRNLLTIRCARLFLTLSRRCWRMVLRLVAGSVPLAKKLYRLLRWLIVEIWHLTGRLWRGFWGLVAKCLRALGRTLDRLISMLPLMWQWLLAGAAMLVLLLLGVNGSGVFSLACLMGSVAIVLYGAHCFGILAESTRHMSQGDLDIQVDDPWMLGAFRDFADDLNGLAGVAVVAAQKQLKSERMKTELITNVSHDIKTPLTSIINFVDLLQKPHTEEEGKQYLEVLDRQSQRLKKLIEDLMEMSKASTGNMAVDIRPLDAVETVNQALGEFADKLEKAQLIPVFRRPEDSVTMLADGRLAWRVLSNLLSNAVKYALPGTRLYIDLMEVEGKIVLSLKNISREELNMEADELMERFVRGDSSRNTEGSGLGLNIAKSLMELQKGQLQLLVDGDLFKVTLIFPSEK